VLKVDRVVLPVTPSAPPTVVLLAMAAEFKVASPLAPRVVVLIPPFAVSPPATPRVPPMLALLVTFAEFSVGQWRPSLDWRRPKCSTC
jgi:hypothetical protein